MLSGIIRNQQEFIDIVNGCLNSKKGVLNLYTTKISLSVHMENGNILGFFVDEIKGVESQIANAEALLIFYMVELFNSPFAFFSFREDLESDRFLLLNREVHVEELILQAQLASVEFASLLEKIITPYAILKAQQPFPDMDLFNGKSVYEIIANSPSSFTDTVRKIKDLIAKDFLDVHQFYNPKSEKDSTHVSVIMRGIDANKIKLISIMENLALSRFSGFLKISFAGEPAYIYYLEGKPSALHPINYPIFDLLIDIKNDAKVSAVKLDDRTTKLLMLRHSSERVIAGVSDNFMEVGKILIGISIENKSGIIIIRSSGNTYYILYENGKILSFLKEGDEGIVEIVSDLDIKHPYWVDVVFFQNLENMDKAVYLSLINIAYGILLRSGNENIINSVKNYIASSEKFKYEEGVIKYRKVPQDSEDIVAFLSFLLDLGYKILGEKRLEEELQQILQPYKDVFNVLRVQDYIKPFVGSSNS